MAVWTLGDWALFVLAVAAGFWGFVFRVRQAIRRWESSGRPARPERTEGPKPPGRFTRIPRTRKRNRPRWKDK